MATSFPAREQLIPGLDTVDIADTVAEHAHETMPQRVLAWWHLTSLDAPTVAVVWALAFAQAARVHLPIWAPVGLALCAWTVYIGDRVLDAYRAMRPATGGFAINGLSTGLFRPALHEREIENLRPRHFFHWRHRRILLPLAVTSALAAIGIVLGFMPMAARERNSVLAVAALVYFTSVHSPWRSGGLRFRLPKELLVGILFTAACAIPAWVRLPWNLTERMTLLPSLLVFMALAWLNCEAIERWESGLSSRSIWRVAIALCAGCLVAAAISAMFHQSQHGALLAAAGLAAALIAVLDRVGTRMRPTTLRAAADLALLTPALLFFLR